jgi:hypothetical protein
MSGWARTADGWAVNLDGSDGGLVFSLPRVELRSSIRGWRAVCFLAGGGRHEWNCASASSLTATKAMAVSQARGLVGPAGRM